MSDRADLTQEHQSLLEAAMKRPGVAEVMRIYQAASVRTIKVAAPAPKIRFSTGGNS